MLEDLYPIEELPIFDSKGTLKRSEIEVASVMPDNLGSQVFFGGLLPNGTSVLTYKMELRPIPVAPDRTPESEVSPVLARKLQESLVAYPARGDIIPVYWFSPAFLPSTFRGKRYVDSLVPSKVKSGDLKTPPLFRKKSFTPQQFQEYMIQMLSHVPAKSVRTIIREELAEEEEGSEDALRVYAANRPQIKFIQFLSSYTLEKMMEHASRRSEGKSESSLQLFIHNMGKFTDFELSFGTAAYFDSESLLARIMLGAERRGSGPKMFGFALDDFHEARGDFYKEFESELGRILEGIPPAEPFTSREVSGLLNQSLMYTVGNYFSPSVGTLPGSFGGFERRRIRR